MYIRYYKLKDLVIIVMIENSYSYDYDSFIRGVCLCFLIFERTTPTREHTASY